MKRLFLSLFLFLATLTLLAQSLTVNAFGGSEVAYAQHDVRVRSGSGASTNYEGEVVIYSGYLSGYQYGLVYINETDLRTAYDYGTFNDYVHLKIYMLGDSGDAGTDTWNVTVYRITTSWDNATVTYNTKPTFSDPIVSKTVTMNDPLVREFVYLDIHDDFEDVLLEEVDYYGYMIYAATPTQADRMVNFMSVEGAGQYEACIVYGYDEEEEDDAEASDDYVDNITEFLTLALVVFFPALALGGSLASSPQTASLAPMGFVAGLVIGVCLGVIVGIVPAWAVVFVGMGVILLLWGAIKH